ncbi:MAG: LPS-assembly protein LptD [Filimonas sp.]|nr:LPS-assembly protein LptD [Filimonas sp.]
MGKRRKVSIKKFLTGLVCILLFFITFAINAKGKRGFAFLQENTADTTKTDTTGKNKKLPVQSTASITDSAKKITDTTRKPKVDTLAMSKDSINAPVEYNAEDSAVLLIPSKKFILYNKANVKYQGTQIEANNINYDQGKNLIRAYGGTDTSSNPLNLPKITQDGSTSISDTIWFNTASQRALTKNTYYTEPGSEMFVFAKRIKKVDTDVEYAYDARFTTCNLDTPHFAFHAKKVKLINNKIAVSGPAYPEFEGVPMPVAIPFGIYPLYKGRHSGFLPPQFTSNDRMGLGLEGLGYYKVINDNWDVTTRADIYTYGGYKLVINPKYMERYKYSGNLNLSIQHTKSVSTGLSKDEFDITNTFMLNWSHTVDTRARPGTSFSANVNAGSTKFNQNVPNNVSVNFQNQLYSSISYSKTWDDGKYNLTMSANHNQNNYSHLININVPTVNFTATTVYPFQKKEAVGTPKWYEKLGISYTGTMLNQIAFYDTSFSFKRLLDTAQWGVQHNIPITLALPALGPFIISPSVSYAERWYGQKILRNWNDSTNKVDTSIYRGFYAAREVQFGLAFNTRIFGTFNFGKSSLRHEIKPFLSLNYKPDLVKKYYTNVQIDSTGKNFRRMSQFDGSPVGSFGEGQFGGMNFGIDNLFEMKVKNPKDTTGDHPTKKIRLIDGLSLNSGYNFFADSLKWSPISISLRSTLFEKVNITAGATIDPYAVDTLGNRIDKLLWKQGSIGRFTGGNIAVSTSFQSKSKDGKKDSQRLQPDQTMTPDEQQRQLDMVRNNPAEYVDFDIPWSLQTSLSVNFSRILNPDLKGFTTQINSNLNVNGDFSLTPKWKIGGGTYFDFRTAKIQTLTMFITREMHCWQMAINITPVGPYKSFNIVLNPKAGILRDLKINRSRFFYN